MQERAPSILELSPYAHLYHEHTFTMSPRTECVAAAVVMAIAIGLVYAALMRLVDLGPDPSWAAFTFLCPLIYHINGAAFAASYIPDEMLYVFFRKRGWKFRYLNKARMTEFLARITIMNLIAFTPAVALGYAVNYVLDGKFPAPYYRQVPYSGGG